MSRFVATIAVLTAVTALAVAPAIGGPGKFQSFDNRADYDAEFVPFGPVDDIVNNFTDVGWKDSIEAGGGQGEFGGTFARSPERIAVYDLELDDPWTLDDPLTIRAKYFARDINMDGHIYMGFDSVDDFTGDAIDSFGWWMLEGRPTFRSGIRIGLNEPGADDSNVQDTGRNLDQIVDVPHETVLQIDWQYTPTGGEFGEGEIVYTLHDITTGEEVLVDARTWPLAFGARNSGLTFNAFGWDSGGAPQVGQQVDAFFDDVCYGTNPECGGGPGPFVPLAGDANGDKQVNTDDIVQILAAGKYETGQPATFAEGDFDDDGFFASGDILAMLALGLFETGPYAALKDAAAGDGTDQVVINYNSADGNFSVTAKEAITSVSLESASGIFSGAAAGNLGGPFDVDSDPKIFKAVFGSNFTEVDFGAVAAAGLAKDLLLSDLSASGSLAAGGTYGPDVQLNYIIPEPSSILLLALGLAGLLHCGRRQR